MMRMIASELAGRELLPSDIIATEATSGTTVPIRNPPATPQPGLFPNPVPTETAVCRTDFLEATESWLIGIVQRPTIRFITAMLVIAFILKLDTRHRRAAV
jgi:hypothetical protein